MYHFVHCEATNESTLFETKQKYKCSLSSLSQQHTLVIPEIRLVILSVYEYLYIIISPVTPSGIVRVISGDSDNHPPKVRILLLPASSSSFQHCYLQDGLFISIYKHTHMNSPTDLEIS